MDKDVLQERIFQGPCEQIVKVPMSQMVEQMIDVSALEILEESVEDVKQASQEQVSHRTVGVNRGRLWSTVSRRKDHCVDAPRTRRAALHTETLEEEEKGRRENMAVEVEKKKGKVPEAESTSKLVYNQWKEGENRERLRARRESEENAKSSGEQVGGDHSSMDEAEKRRSAGNGVGHRMRVRREAKLKRNKKNNNEHSPQQAEEQSQQQANE